jgi:hypothetical protein
MKAWFASPWRGSLARGRGADVRSHGGEARDHGLRPRGHGRGPRGRGRVLAFVVSKPAVMAPPGAGPPTMTARCGRVPSWSGTPRWRWRIRRAWAPISGAWSATSGAYETSPSGSLQRKRRIPGTVRPSPKSYSAPPKYAAPGERFSAEIPTDQPGSRGRGGKIPGGSPVP